MLELYSKTKFSKHIILWCSPGFGVVDVWLPVIKKLKEKGNIKIDFIFPEPSSIQKEEKNSSLFNFAEQYVDDVIYRGSSNRWFIAPTLIEARAYISYSNMSKNMQVLSKKLLKGKGSKYFLLRTIGKYISAISKYVFRMEEDFGQHSLYDFNLLRNANGILCDIVKEGKFVNKELRNELKDIQKFSMFHAMGAIWVTPDFTCIQPVTKRSDVTVYNMSHLEEDGYKKCFGILGKNLVHAGIPKHDSDWIEFTCNQSFSDEDVVFDSYVFIIGRPASPFNTVERKKKALRDIHEVICNKYKLKLVVKTHPKESLNGIDGQIYRNALGPENYGKTWMFSNMHPYKIGEKAIFNISFFSGVVNDMLVLNKPTIEYLDLSRLEAYDNNNSLRDENGEPVFEYRYAGLVLGASSKLELEQHVESILNKYEETLLPLRSKYEEYYVSHDNASEFVADDICTRLNY